MEFKTLKLTKQEIRKKYQEELNLLFDSKRIADNLNSFVESALDYYRRK